MTAQSPTPSSVPTQERPAHLTRDPRSVEVAVPAIARSALEIVRDLRPATALTRMVTPEVAAQLSRRAALTRRLRGGRPAASRLRVAVTGVRTCIIDGTTVEASAVLRESTRARFIAMRWELRHTGWRVTVLEIG